MSATFARLVPIGFLLLSSCRSSSVQSDAENREGVCDDFADNDNDGLTDCDDPDCDDADPCSGIGQGSDGDGDADVDADADVDSDSDSDSDVRSGTESGGEPDVDVDGDSDGDGDSDTSGAWGTGTKADREDSDTIGEADSDSVSLWDSDSVSLWDSDSVSLWDSDSVSLWDTGADTDPDSDTGGPTDTNVDDPPGFWHYRDWQGCAWTLVTGSGDLDMIHPEDFKDKRVEDPYCVSGAVEGEEEFAAMGFNLNESAATADCGTNPLVLEEPPPGVVLGGSGIALSFYVTHANLPEFRIQLTSPQGNSVEGETWCADLTDFYLGGTVFIPYTDFNTKCWDNSGEAFDPETAVSSVSFVIVGETYGTTFDYCIQGFAAGDSEDDAPVSYDK